MSYIDLVTIVTAIIGATLGIINLIINIHGKMEEKVKIYTDTALSLDINFYIEECQFKGDYYELTSDIHYDIKVLNNKNRAVVVEDIYLSIKT